MRGSRGPTAIEAAIVAAIVAVGGAVAVASARSRRIDANESSAIVALSRIAAAQEQFQAAAYADVDQDGIGEYGLLQELTGRAGVRWTADGAATGDAVPSPLLDATFRRISRRGELRRAGYRIHVVLPGAAGVGVVEHGGALPSAIDTDLAETTWGCFAWPERFGVTGERTFFVNQTETIVGQKNPRYSGANDLATQARRGALRPGAALHVKDLSSIVGDIAAYNYDYGPVPWTRDESTSLERSATETDGEANEASVIKDLRAIAGAQRAMATSGAIDLNYNGQGEFGLLRELAGVVGHRTSADASTNDYSARTFALPRGFTQVTPNHETLRSGYLMRLMLPDAVGDGIPEVGGTAALSRAINSNYADSTWCCYAWPTVYGRTGRRTFLINQDGVVVATEDERYSGTGMFGWSERSWLKAGAAFPQRSLSPESIMGPSVHGATGRDGNLWREVPDRPSSQAHSVRGKLVGTGSDLSGTFRIEADVLTNDTRERATVRVANLPSGPHRVRLVATDGETFDLGRLRLQPDDTWLLRDDAIVSDPAGDGSLARFAGGTIDVVDASDTLVARGAIPDLATPFGPPVRGASLVYRATAELEPDVASDLLEGSAELRIVNQPGGRRETLTIDVTTADRAARPIDVLLVRDLGRIVPRDLDGHGRLVFDSRRGPPLPFDARALSENRIELRDEAGAVIARGRFPVVE